jgi:hypothetical protein
MFHILVRAGLVTLIIINPDAEGENTFKVVGASPEPPDPTPAVTRPNLVSRDTRLTTAPVATAQKVCPVCNKPYIRKHGGRYIHIGNSCSPVTVALEPVTTVELTEQEVAWLRRSGIRWLNKERLATGQTVLTSKGLCIYTKCLNNSRLPYYIPELIENKIRARTNMDIVMSILTKIRNVCGTRCESDGCYQAKWKDGKSNFCKYHSTPDEPEDWEIEAKAARVKAEAEYTANKAAHKCPVCGKQFERRFYSGKRGETTYHHGYASTTGCEPEPIRCVVKDAPEPEPTPSHGQCKEVVDGEQCVNDAISAKGFCKMHMWSGYHPQPLGDLALTEADPAMKLVFELRRKRAKEAAKAAATVNPWGVHPTTTVPLGEEYDNKVSHR